MSVTEHVAEDLGKCPFCDGSIAASLDPPMMMHSLPMCDRFKRESVEDFAESVRRARSLPKSE